MTLDTHRTSESAARNPPPGTTTAGSPPSGRRPPGPAGPVSPLVSALAAGSVLAGASALTAIVSGYSWIGPTVQIVGLVWLVGLGCRLLRLPAPVTVVGQAAAIVLTITAIFTTTGYGGLIPSTRTLHEVQVILSAAWDQIIQSTVPAPSTPQLALLIATTLGLLALVVDFFVSEVDAPALVALPLLCLYSVPASIADQLLPWWTFALPAVCYAALVAIAGHPGRRVGGRAAFGVLIAGGLAVAVAVAGSLFAADAVTGVGTTGRINRDSGANAGGTVGISPFAQLHGDLQQGTPRDLLQITGLPQPDYLRVMALESWDPNRGFALLDPTADSQPVQSPITIEPLARNASAQTAEIGVQVLDFADRFLPIFQGTTSITGLAGGYRYSRDLGAVFQQSPVRPDDYRMTVSYGQLSPEQLRTDTVSPSNILLTADGIPDSAVQLARTITAAGTTPFDRAVLLKDYFTDPKFGFTYSLQVPVGNTGNLLSDFLLNKRGYCEQYAAAMAVMLRSIDIPARVAIGFTQGAPIADGSSLITSHNAHAWVEVQFDNAGWVRFDPTPLTQSIGGQQGYETSSAPTPQDTALTPSASNSAESAPETQVETRTTTSTVLVGSGSAEVGGWRSGYTVALIVAALLAVATAAPSWWRRRRTARRWALIEHGGPAAAPAAWAEVEDLAIDHGFTGGRDVTVRKAANQLARDARLSEEARAGLRRIALGTEAAWYAPPAVPATHGHTSVVPKLELVGAPAGTASGPRHVQPDGPPTGSSAATAGRPVTHPAAAARAGLHEGLAADVRRIGLDLEHFAPRRLRARIIPRSLYVKD